MNPRLSPERPVKSKRQLTEAEEAEAIESNPAKVIDETITLHRSYGV